MKFPPYGKPIAERLRYRNEPDHLVVCIGLDAWKRAKEWNAAPNDCPAIVMPAGTDPQAYTWPVSGQLVVVDVACGPTDKQLRELAAVLLAYDADVITIVSRDGLNVFKQYIAGRREAA